MQYYPISAGWTQGHNVYIVNLNCSNIKESTGEVFHPYRQINGSHHVDHCVECRCDKVEILLLLDTPLNS